jgi:hypothetical protein
VSDERVWREFCRALEGAGEAVFRAGAPSDAQNRAEGIRYLTRLLRSGLESHVESSDPCYPRFFQLSNETIKIGNDNPDNVYHNANVSGASTSTAFAAIAAASPISPSVRREGGTRRTAPCGPPVNSTSPTCK